MAPKKLDASGENILSVKDVQDPTLKLRAKLLFLSCCSTGRAQVNAEGGSALHELFYVPALVLFWRHFGK